jgi:large repetitive protein
VRTIAIGEGRHLRGPASGFLMNYRVTSVGGAWISQSTVSNSLTLSGLAPSTQYDFELFASNMAGTGPASTIRPATRLPCPGCARPGHRLCRLRPNSQFRFTGMDRARDRRGRCRVHRAVPHHQGTGSWTTAATGVVATAYRVTGLVAATAYDFQVLAVNVIGNGTASATANATTLLALPGLPTALMAGAETSTTMPLT